MLSSKISHTAAEAAHLFTDASSCTPHLLANILGDAGVGANTGVGTATATAAVGGSTSTTRNTALPSNTRCTLSWSQLPGWGAYAAYGDDDDVEEVDKAEEEEDPVNASQNAEPNFLNTV